MDEKNRRKILVVDDNNISRRVMCQILKGMHINVEEAKNGYEAIDMIKKDNFDMIFMDIFMPLMDGYETSLKIRDLGGTKGNIPIIAVTGEDLEFTERKIVEYKINDVLAKPFRKEDLEKLFEKSFDIENSYNDVQTENLPIFNQGDFELFYEDKKFRKEILTTFFGDQHKDLEKISKAFKEADCESIHDALHYMKGSFTYLKAERILDLTERILDFTYRNELNETLLLEKQLMLNYSLLLKELLNYYKTL
ncbi:MAG: response regulator [Bacilli bacterium]|nr:response regulator [Bacilli bacterium]